MSGLTWLKPTFPQVEMFTIQNDLKSEDLNQFVTYYYFKIKQLERKITLNIYFNFQKYNQVKDSIRRFALG